MGDNVSEKMLSDFYDKTRIFLRLGFKESGTGLAIREAIGRGCPVVISKDLGAYTIVRSGESGFLVDENNLTDVAERIVTIFKNNDMVRRMSTCAYDLAKEK
jgi:glycosyltransferase involved in cell wall biosynthesis